MSVVSDDEIIKRKLLVEGESGNDDKRMTLLLKNYLHWISSTDSTEWGFDTFQALLGSINQCENAIEQTYLVLLMNEQQQSQYTEVYRQIESEMESAQTRIDQCKEELKKAKIIRRNRKEYDGLAKIIAEHPERDTTLLKCKTLQAQLESLHKMNEECDRKIELRKKQFHLFLMALDDLRRTIDADDIASESTVTLEDPSTMDVS